MIGTPKKRAKENNVAASLSQGLRARNGEGRLPPTGGAHTWGSARQTPSPRRKESWKMLSPHSQQMSIFLIQRTFPSPAVYNAVSWILCTKKIIKQTTLDPPSN